jgi:hypothetical protein
MLKGNFNLLDLYRHFLNDGQVSFWDPISKSLETMSIGLSSSAPSAVSEDKLSEGLAVSKGKASKESLGGTGV